MVNKRLRERIQFQTDIILTIGKSKKKYTKTSDISMNGLFVETEDITPLNTEGKMELILHSGELKKIIKSKFRVLRVVDSKKNNEEKNLRSGFGIGLMDFEEDSSEKLFNIIKYN